MKPRKSSLFVICYSAVRIVFTSASIGTIVSTTYAADATWNGTTDAAWVDDSNWSATPAPGTGNTATFNNSGNDNTTIDLTGGITIGNILFDTANAAAYTIGSGAVGNQTLTLNNTAAITVNSSVSHDQIFNSAITLGTTRDAATTTITNNSTSDLTFNGAVTGAPAGGTAGNKTLAFGGTGDITFNGNISKGGAANLWLTKSGAGTLFLNGTTTLTASNAAHNVVSVNDGGIIDLGDDGELIITSTINTARGIFTNSSGTISGGTISNGASIRFDTAGSQLTINSQLTRLAGTVNGAGTLRLTNANNSFTEDLRITGPSTVIVTSIGALGNAANIQLSTTNFGPATLVFEGEGGQLNKSFSLFNGGSATGVIDQSGTGLLEITGNVTGGNAGSLTLRGSTSGAGEISGNITTGTTPLIKSGTGTWTLSGANTYTGATTISGGTLQIGNGGTLGNVSAGVGSYSANIAIAATNSGRFVYNSTATQTLGGVISGAGQLVIDNGTLILTNTNTYTGQTLVNAGTLIINGSTHASSAVTVGNNATLKGSGTINGTVTIQSGGTLASGTSIESLGMGTLNLDNLSTFEYEIDKSAAASIAGDLTAVVGNLNITNGAILTISELGLTGSWNIGDKLTLISYGDLWNGGLFTYEGQTLNNSDTFAFSGMNWMFLYDDVLAGTNFTSDLTWDGIAPGGGFVTMTALSVIPEPRAALLGALGFLALLRRRR